MGGDLGILRNGADFFQDRFSLPYSFPQQIRGHMSGRTYRVPVPPNHMSGIPDNERRLTLPHELFVELEGH